jgi:hypothetical protein
VFKRGRCPLFTIKGWWAGKDKYGGEVDKYPKKWASFR